MRVAIQGQAASFHDIAARQFFGNNIEIKACQTFRETFDALLNSSVDTAIVAVENSLYGPINPVYDLLLEKRTWVSGEVYLRIEHCLIGSQDAKLENITEVHSQVMALAQCEDWLEEHLPHARHIEQHDTTGSVVLVKEWGDPTKAAIASKQAADLHDLKILAHNIEDHHQNFTRFFVLQRDQKIIDKANKSSIILRTTADTRPGALYNALGVFAKRDINIYSLQSRPIVGKAWHYMFYLDIALGTHDSQFNTIASELSAQNCDVTILGSYKNGLS